ncbi:CAAD domain-containing protein [Oscillatoria sp. CS-180]|nr:CAAD domain-containing protein [Oscillatoria sp. CS-180]MDB9525897.1 CAAD domain-containing protein [Oscillatoria sp. CS-180]
MRPLLEEPLTYLERFFSNFRRPMTFFLLLFVLVILLQILLAVANTLDSIPLVAPFLKLVGIGYTIWFVGQKLLYADQRRQTLANFDRSRREIVGEAKEWLENRSTTEPYSTEAIALPVAQEAADTAEHVQSTAPSELPAEQIESPEQTESSKSPVKMFAGVTGTVQVLIPLTGLVDVDALKAKIEKDLTKVEGEIKSLSGRLSNPGFVNKAPAEVVQGARDALAEAETQAKILKSRLEML